MNILFFFKGFIIGLGVSALVGPIGLFCIRRSLTYGALSGIFAGLGAAVADTLFATIAAFSLQFLSTLLLDHLTLLRFLGGIALLILGTQFYFSQPQQPTKKRWGKGLATSFFATFFLTISNPMTILFFGGLFALLGVQSSATAHDDALLLVLGVLIGSISWWTILNTGIYLFRSKANAQFITRLSKISGIFIICFGLLTLFSLFVF